MLSTCWKSVACLTFLGLLLGSGVATAQDYSSPPSRSPGRTAPGRPASAMPGGDQLVVPGYWALGLKSVQAEVGLTPTQKQELREMSDKYQAAMQRSYDRLRDLPPQEQQKKMAEIRELTNQLFQAARKKVETILTPQQVRMLQTIDFRMRVPGMLATPAAQEELGLSEPQRQRLQGIYEDAQAKAQQLQRETADRVLYLLTPEQQTKLRQQLESAKP